MSKNIVIQQDGTGRQFTADMLKTALVGGGDKNWSTYNGGDPVARYIGVVSGVEADAAIIANQQTIMAKLGIGT